jgi:CRISPR/Cas system-associated endonuclease/helicase Cas3
MNPKKVRTEYGKFVYLLQDAVRVEQEGLLEYGNDEDADDNNKHNNGSDHHHHHYTSLIAPIERVYKFLEERNGLDLLRDKDIEIATEEILAKPGKTRQRIDQEDIHLCLYSICDNNSFLNSNRVLIDKVIAFLKTQFSPMAQLSSVSSTSQEYSLAIVKGQEGAQLSHSHE